LKKAVVTGITGQDGAYLAQLLLEEGCLVYGAHRRSSSTNFWRLDALGILKHPKLTLVEFDLTDQASASRLIKSIKPDEVYNLAAQSFVGASFDQPITTANINAIGVLNLLEAIRENKPDAKFYQASTSEMFGKVKQTPQNEDTPFHPRSPYGVSKLFAHWIAINYRESYNIFAACGILFNHESPLRGEEFVTRKITQAVAKIKLGLLDKLELGCLSAKRDWGYAREYVEGMRRILRADKPDAFVLATGRTETVREFVTISFRAVGEELIWNGTGELEHAVSKSTGKTLAAVNPKFYRPAEVELLIGDPSKAERQLGWKANTSLEELCALMVQADITNLKTSPKH
jgi:GDPmannose 4,6-dehydratase